MTQRQSQVLDTKNEFFSKKIFESKALGSMDFLVEGVNGRLVLSLLVWVTFRLNSKR